MIFLAVSSAGMTNSDPGHMYSSGNWKSLDAKPGPIRSASMAYSPDDKKIVLYGGRDPQGLFVNELWVFDVISGKWIEKTGWTCMPKCPAGRAVHSMVYDDFHNKFVVFGGYLISGHSFETNETWTYDLSSNKWLKLDFHDQQIPEPRHWGSLEYDPETHLVYLFGGHFNNGKCPGDIMYNDVWRLNLSGSIPTWKNMKPEADPKNGKPEPRQSDWIYNRFDNAFYVFGGKQELGPKPGSQCNASAESIQKFFNDIWRYDPVKNQWTLIQSGQSDYTHYPKERRTQMVFDEQNNRMLMFSGLLSTDFEYGEDTWIYDFDDRRWSTMQDSDSVLPPTRTTFAATWDSNQNVMYIYGIGQKDSSANFWKLTFISNNISVNCFDKQPVIFGTERNDDINGNKGRNVIYSLPGDDTIRGGRGSDFLCGGVGNDKIYGEDGDDKIFGFSGNDELYGSAGNDRLVGGAANDILSGGPGADIFDCGSGIDTILDFNRLESDTKTSDCEKF
jgi:hemolysin type calcium-binding protein/galactose oxidase-like protein